MKNTLSEIVNCLAISKGSKSSNLISSIVLTFGRMGVGNSVGVEGDWGGFSLEFGVTGEFKNEIKLRRLSFPSYWRIFFFFVLKNKNKNKNKIFFEKKNKPFWLKFFSDLYKSSFDFPWLQFLFIGLFIFFSCFFFKMKNKPAKSSIILIISSLSLVATSSSKYFSSHVFKTLKTLFFDELNSTLETK